MNGRRWRLPRMQEAGLVLVIVIISLVLSFAGGKVEIRGKKVNNFFRTENLLGVSTDMARFAIMAVGATIVIISGGIDISVGSAYALAALGTAAMLQQARGAPDPGAWHTVGLGLAVACAIGLACGLINGLIVVGLRMHPFIVTLGTMSIFRGIGNVSVIAKTLPEQPRKVLPESFTRFFMYAPRPYVHVVPLAVTAVCVIAGVIYLSLMVAGRETYAVGGNEEAARFSGLRIGRIKLRVYAIAGLCAGIAGLVSAGFTGSASTNTGQGYELTVIAAAVVGGASLTGGRGTAIGALLGTLIIKLIENGILILKLNREYSSIIIGVAIILAVAVDRFSEYVRARRLAGGRGKL